MGSGKTALLLALCTSMRDEYSIGVVTNDIFTREDAEFLIHNNALGEERIVAVETGGCPHAAIRDDISMNLCALEDLMLSFHGKIELLFLESGGDNLARLTLVENWPISPSTSLTCRVEIRFRVKGGLE